MTLHFPLQVNGHTIGTFEARRITELTVPDDCVEFDDAVHDYSVDMRMHPGHLGRPASRHTFTVSHRYGDGPFALVQRCIAESVYCALAPTK